MVDRRIPLDVSRSARLILAYCWLVSDDDAEVELWGSPPSALTTLMECTGHQRKSVWEALRELHEKGHVLVRYRTRDGALVDEHGGGNVLTVKVLAEPPASSVCDACSRKTKGTGRWCADCKQTVGRADRSWQVAALELLKLGYEPTRIASILDRPLFAASANDGRNANGGAVVPFLISKGMLGEEWRERLRNALNGEPEEA